MVRSTWTPRTVREAVAAVMANARPTQINLNLRDVSFIDSVGISALVAVSGREVGGVNSWSPNQLVRAPATGVTGLPGCSVRHRPAAGAG